MLIRKQYLRLSVIMENKEVNYVRKKLKSLTGITTDSVFQRFRHNHKAMPAMELFLMKLLVADNIKDPNKDSLLKWKRLRLAQTSLYSNFVC